jgi:hypothetical protein
MLNEDRSDIQELHEMGMTGMCSWQVFDPCITAVFLKVLNVASFPTTGT